MGNALGLELARFRKTNVISGCANDGAFWLKRLPTADSESLPTVLVAAMPRYGTCPSSTTSEPPRRTVTTGSPSSGVRCGHDRHASPYLLDLYQHQKRAIGPAHACKFHRFPGNFQRCRAGSDVVCTLWNYTVDRGRDHRQLWQELKSALQFPRSRIVLAFAAGVTMTFHRFLILVIFLLPTSLFSQTPKVPADLIITGGTVVTMD